MPWNLRWPFGRQEPKARSGAVPEVGQPPASAEPIVEPRLQDIGTGSYELPLPERPPEEESPSD